MSEQDGITTSAVGTTIDRRSESKHKSTVNTSRFIKRNRARIKEQVNEQIRGRSIKDIDRGADIVLPRKGIKEDHFHINPGTGDRDIIHPGNKDFISGDTVARPQGGGASGRAGNSGEGEDDFGFHISREEFLELFFEDLELPNLVKKQLAQISKTTVRRAGFTTSGIPMNLHIPRTIREGIKRRIAGKGGIAELILEKEEELEELRLRKSDHDSEVQALIEEIEELHAKVAPFFDEHDQIFRSLIKVPKPSTRAVMFCIMDVSGSMTEELKDIAKRFFILLYLFLRRTYDEDQIDVVFIRHHTAAIEVDEEEFFHSRETGGTTVSKALSLMRDIIEERYSGDTWNIYGAQASDGDNWKGDSPVCRDLLVKEIMPLVQYFAYIEIKKDPQELWSYYEQVEEAMEENKFAMKRVPTVADIYPVFRELFKKEGVDA